MLKLISSLILSALTLAPTLSSVNVDSAPPPPNTIIVSARRDNLCAGGDYTVIDKSVDESYKELKAKLDKRFEYMFSLKEKLEKNQAQVACKWDEYYALHAAYEKELKKIIADWVTNQQYN